MNYLQDIKKVITESILNKIHNGWQNGEKIIIYKDSYYVKVVDVGQLIRREIEKYEDRLLKSKVKHIRKYINTHGVSKTYIANRLKYSPSYLSMLLQHKRKPKDLDKILSKIDGILNSKFSTN